MGKLAACRTRISQPSPRSFQPFHITALNILVLFLAPIYLARSRSFSFGLKRADGVVDSYVLRRSPNNLNEQTGFSPLIVCVRLSSQDASSSLLSSLSTSHFRNYYPSELICATRQRYKRSARLRESSSWDIYFSF